MRSKSRPARRTYPIVLFDDVGFSDFGCYGSAIRHADHRPAGRRGIALHRLPHHRHVLDDARRAADRAQPPRRRRGLPRQFRFRLSRLSRQDRREAGTLAEMLRPHGYRNYMIGKWHVTPLTESGATGPFDGWPPRRGFDRFYGFPGRRDGPVRARTRAGQYAHHAIPGHVRDRLSPDRRSRGSGDPLHRRPYADRPDQPWLTWVALGACHAPHQAPADLIRPTTRFAHGWDEERGRRLRARRNSASYRKIRMPARNDFVRDWDDISRRRKARFTRLQAPYAAMLTMPTSIWRGWSISWSARALRDDTTVVVMSDNGASQEGGPLGMFNAMGPVQFPLRDRWTRKRPADRRYRRAEIAHSNFPLGWAMAANTPLRRYKQNTHGGGIRDPLVISWPKGIRARGELRHQFAHASDLAPTLLDIVGVAPPRRSTAFRSMPMTGVSFRASLRSGRAAAQSPQYFEMFGHAALVAGGWKAVAYHPPARRSTTDRWELFHLDADFNETTTTWAAGAGTAGGTEALWWREAEANTCCRSTIASRRASPTTPSASTAPDNRFVLHAGMGHVPTDVAPGRSLPQLHDRGGRERAGPAAPKAYSSRRGDATSWLFSCTIVTATSRTTEHRRAQTV